MAFDISQRQTGFTAPPTSGFGDPRGMSREDLIDEVEFLRGELGSTADLVQTAEERQRLGLTPMEYRTAAALARANGRTLTVPQIMDAIESEAEDPKVVSVYICQIRHALKFFDAIKTIPTVGYSMTPAGKDAFNRMRQMQEAA